MRACEGIATDGSLASVPARRSADVLGLKALVLLEPFGAPFTRQGLDTLDMPVLIYYALQSDFSTAGNALALAKALPGPTTMVGLSGGHFLFIDPCPPALASEARQLCVDAAGVDRVAIHGMIGPAIVAFLRQNLNR